MYLLSKAHKYAHTHTATHAAKYILGSVGKDSSCPAGYAQARKANCGAAARAAGVAAGANNRNSGFLEGNWQQVPAGCSIYAPALTQSSIWRPHWNGLSSGENDGDYRVVCELLTGVKLLCLGVFMVYLLYAFVCKQAWLCMYVRMYVCSPTTTAKPTLCMYAYLYS